MSFIDIKSKININPNPLDYTFFSNNNKNSTEQLNFLFYINLILYKNLIEEKQREQSKYNKNDYVACAIGAKKSKHFVFGSSDGILNNYDEKLEKILIKKLGVIGKKSQFNSNNIIGRCAEVKAANAIMCHCKNTYIRAINFTQAIRPRTLEPIKRCENCIVIFGKE